MAVSNPGKEKKRKEQNIVTEYHINNIFNTFAAERIIISIL